MSDPEKPVNPDFTGSPVMATTPKRRLRPAGAVVQGQTPIRLATVKAHASLVACVAAVENKVQYQMDQGTVANCVGMIPALSSGINLSDHAARSMI
jgi:hypothetical protein